MEITVSEDKEFIKKVREKLLENDGYCPCKIEKIPDNKCICKEFLESDESGACQCGLYIKVV